MQAEITQAIQGGLLEVFTEFTYLFRSDFAGRPIDELTTRTGLFYKNSLLHFFIPLGLAFFNAYNFLVTDKVLKFLFVNFIIFQIIQFCVDPMVLVFFDGVYDILLGAIARELAMFVVRGGVRRSLNR